MRKFLELMALVWSILTGKPPSGNDIGGMR